MYNQSNRERFRKLGTKALDSSLVIENQGIGRSVDYGRKTKFKTDLSIDTPDSLQLFQEEINSVLKGARKKNSENRNAKTAAGRSVPAKQTIQIKDQLNKMKNMLESQTELKLMEDRLQKLLVQLQAQKGRQQSRVAQQLPIIVPPQQSPIFMQQPMYPQYQYPQYPQYPPPIYYPPPPSYYPKPRRKNRKDYDDDSEESEDGFRRKKSRRDPKNKTQNSSRYPGSSKQRIRTRLRIYLFAVLFTKFLKSEAKKLSTVRKTNLKRFWTEKFQSQIQNLKNWLLDTQKFSLAIILQKKHLNLVFFDDKSDRVRDQKKKLIMQIIGIGVNKILQDATPQKISLFSEILLNLCRKGSYAVSRFWTVAEMQQICISEYFGFFRIDTEQQKFLIGLLVFIKVFVFNMFLQPYKFDSKNFPKKQEPTTTNMKLISSAYYLMIKDIINQFRDHERDNNIYKVGNWLEVKKQFIVQCSEPLIFGNEYPQEGEYISGLFTAEELSELKDFETWETCSNKMKTVVDKLHSEMLAKGKMVKKNLKYKLYN